MRFDSPIIATHFINELGNEIDIHAWSSLSSIKYKIVGPNSEIENIITRKEATMLVNALVLSLSKQHN